MQILFLLLTAVTAHAGVWEFISKNSYQMFTETCSAKKNSNVCSGRIDPTQKLALQAQPISEEIYLANLAHERAETDQCAIQFVSSLDQNAKSFDLYASDIESKIDALSEEMAAKARLERKVYLNSGGESAAKHQAEIKKIDARIASIKNSIALVDHQEIRNLLASQLHEMLGNNTSVDALTAGPAQPIKKLDSAKFRSRLKNALQKVHSQISADVLELRKGEKTNGASLDRVTRESLAQDRDLVQRFLERNPQVAVSSQKAICEVNATYGRGAEIRDQVVFGGSAVLTVASMGTGLAARGAVASAAAATPARLAAARGLVALRSSRILGTAAIGMDGISALKEIDRCPQHQAQIKTSGGKSADRCEDYKIESLESSNCYLSAALTALGGAASSEKVQNLIAKISGSPLGAVEKAHLVGAGQAGRDGTPAAVGNYTWSQLREKAEVLRSQGVSPAETRKLMEAKVVGLSPQESKGSLSAYFSKSGDEISKSAQESQKTKAAFLENLKPSEAPNTATREFREAYKNGGFDEKNQYISYKPGGVGERYLVKADYVEADGTLRAVDSDGNVVQLNLKELQTARVSSSPDVIREFKQAEKARISNNFSSEAKDPATSEFRDRWARGNFQSPSETAANPSIISYVGADGQRYPARVQKVSSDGRVTVQTHLGTSEVLNSKSMESARMASANSTRSFLENEKVVHVDPAKAISQFQKNIDAIAPKIDLSGNGSNRGTYMSNGYWRQWMDPKAMSSMPEQGWKLHVGATPESAEKIAQSLIPELQKRGILHKVVDNLEKYAARDAAHDTQAGKFMTIYPRTDQEAKEIADLIDKTMKKQGLGASDFIQPPGEMTVRPGVYARYGRFTDGPLTDAKGRKIPGSQNMLQLPDGRLVPDERGLTSPAGIRSPF